MSLFFFTFVGLELRQHASIIVLLSIYLELTRCTFFLNLGTLFTCKLARIMKMLQQCFTLLWRRSLRLLFGSGGSCLPVVGNPAYAVQAATFTAAGLWCSELCADLNFLLHRGANIRPGQAEPRPAPRTPLHAPLPPRHCCPATAVAGLPRHAPLRPATPRYAPLRPATPRYAPLRPATPRYAPLRPATPRYRLGCA